MSKHLFHLLSTKPQAIKKGGTRLKVTSSNFKILEGMALYRLVLEKNGVREPHWHPNADEMGYCLAGSSMVTLVANGGIRETFCVSQGEMFYIPSGFFHHIENIGATECEFLIAFSHHDPLDFGVSAAMGCMSDAVLGNTWGLKASHFAKLKRSAKNTLIGVNKAGIHVPENAFFPSPYKFDLEGSNFHLDKEEGNVKVARKNVWPILKTLSMYSLKLTDQGMREPHWHPLTAELGYVQEGQARMTVLGPNGDVDTYKLKKGDLYFIPKAYPHHIENIGKNEFHVFIFFDQTTPGDISFSAGVKAYSNAVLGASFETSSTFFKKLPAYTKDLLVVSKVNPVD